MTHVVGLDLSLRCSGVIRVPVSWGGNWSRVRYWLVKPKPLASGASEFERIQRCLAVANELQTVIQPTDKVVVERYAYRQAEGAHWLGELGGIVRLKLMDHLLSLDPLQAVTASQTRRLLCGDGNATKQAVQAALRAAGAPAELTSSLDLCDAMAVANWSLKELGGAWLGVRAKPLRK
jgi:Holliday junction resolvasome RuvABC endonuclease subunit